MIRLAYDDSLYLAHAALLVKRSTNYHVRSLTITASLEDDTFELSCRKMQDIYKIIEDFRAAIDVRGYMASSSGYHFFEGNSGVEKETLRGLPIKVMLYFSDRIDRLERKSPSRINKYQIVGLVKKITSVAPAMIVYDHTVHPFIENIGGPMLTSYNPMHPLVAPAFS